MAFAPARVASPKTTRAGINVGMNKRPLWTREAIRISMKGSNPGSALSRVGSRRHAYEFLLLKQKHSVKVGIKGKRHKAGWDRAYLLKVLQS